MLWSPTTGRSGVRGLTVLLQRKDWNDAEGDRLRSVLRPFLNDSDPVNRWFLARVVHLVERDPKNAIGLLVARLRVEPEFEVGSTLAAQFERFGAKYIDELDEALYEAAFAPWLQPGADPNGQIDYTIVRGFVRVVLGLALRKRTANARSLAQSWFEEPWESKVSERGIVVIRGFLTDGVAEVRSGAFALLLLAAEASERRRLTSDQASEEFQQAFEAVANVCTTIYHGSGAIRYPHGQGTPPPADYLENALPVFRAASAFREPSIVHHVVQTLVRVAPQDPGAALLCLRGLVDRGDPYSYDPLAQKATTDLCARYLSEFWENIADDEGLLTALRETLSVFVAAGHAPAIDLSRRLGNAFR